MEDKADDKDQRKQKKKKSKGKRVAKIIFKGILIFNGILIVGGVGAVGYGYYKYGDKIEATMKSGYEVSAKIKDTDFNNRQPTQFYDANGKLLREFKTNDYYYAKITDMNPYVAKAVVAIEDERFYSHKGIDYEGIARSVWVAVKSKGKTIQGGSTITQQLARNVYLTLDRNMFRKVEEMVVAEELEKKFSKDQIIEFYVNNINYGNGCYSFETASRYYFQKPSKDLTLAEVALLTGVPNNPSIYSPIKNPKKAIEKRNVILGKMLEVGYITQEEYDKAKNEELKLNVKPDSKSQTTDYAMSYAIYNATRDLMEQDGFMFRYSFDNDKDRSEYFDKYNEEYSEKEKDLLGGGYRIETSIDMDKQQKLQEIVDSQLSKYKDKDDKTGLYEKQGASVTIDNNTGEVVAIVGGRSQDGNTFNRGFLAVRQPGSSMKPLIAYTPAFERGYIPTSTYNDAPIENGPKNDDFIYRGSVNLRYAVGISINTIAFRLVNENGVKKSLQYLQNMEFKYITPEDTSPVVAIGGLTKGVTPVEMASGYATIERGGSYIRPTNVKKVIDQRTKTVLYENKHEKTKVYDSGASYLMVDTLKGVLTESYGTGHGLQLNNYPYYAGKTGTTDGSKDCWFVGFTPYYTTSVWVGDDIPANQNMFGNREPGHIWKEYMEYLHQGLEQVDFVKPDTVIEQNGKLMDTLYLETQNDKARKDDEERRIQKENKEQLKRLDKEDYRIVYGLSKEEEEANEKTAEGAVSALEGFKLTNKSQYGDVDKLVETAYNSITNVKHQDTYYWFRNRIESKVSELNKIKSALDKPVEVIPQKPTENETPPQNGENNGGSTVPNNTGGNTGSNAGGNTGSNTGETPTTPTTPTTPSNPTTPTTPTQTTPTTNTNQSGSTTTEKKN